MPGECLSPDGQPVIAAKGLVLRAHYALDDAPPLDVLVYPGARPRAGAPWTSCARSTRA